MSTRKKVGIGFLVVLVGLIGFLVVDSIAAQEYLEEQERERQEREREQARQEREREQARQEREREQARQEQERIQAEQEAFMNGIIERMENTDKEREDNVHSTVPNASDFEAKLNQLMYHPEFIKALINVMEVDGKVNQGLWKACESVGYDDYESFQLFTTIVAEAALLLEAESNLKDQHYVTYATNDYYETNGFPDNPPNFKERWNDFILTKALMGLCFEDLESEFGSFYGMQWGGVGLKDKHHLDVMRDVLKDYLT